MGASSNSEDIVKEQIVDDIKEDVDSKLAALRAKAQSQPKMMSKVVNKKERSINLGIIGAGQAGGRLSYAMSTLGYTGIAINTTNVDLKLLELPDSNKLMISYGLGGAAKELEIGLAAAESNREQILNFINDKLKDSQVNVLTMSLGGGSGAGMAPCMIDILSEIGKPIVVITILPMESEDLKVKQNAVETLNKITNLIKDNKISSCILIDNAKLESIYADVSQLDFFDVANKAIVEPLDAFNTFSSMPSASKAIDQAEFLKLLLDSQGFATYSCFQCSNYTDETAIAEAVINQLSGNLLADGFDLKQSKYVGFILAANKQVWSKINSASVNYANSMVQDLCGNPSGIFRGTYVTDSNEDSVKIYSMFTGLGLPMERLNQLIEETKELTTKAKAKDENRNLTLNLNLGKPGAVSEAQKIKDKIATKNSAFGKLMNTSDRRK